MTLAAITMTAPEAASPVQMYRATYSPDDNKLRLYAASRLDPETLSTPRCLTVICHFHAR
ncbi:hypothetical protein DQ383_004307 [Escherichia coli]|nr:hypothetical protein [Escherichia coli]